MERQGKIFYMCSQKNGLFLSSETNSASGTPVLMRKWKENGYNQLWFEDVDAGVIRSTAVDKELVLEVKLGGSIGTCLY